MRKKREMLLNPENERRTLHTHLNFAGREAYKLLRANLSFVLPGEEGRSCPIIGVTSSIRGEGKSTTATNLAYSVAESGKKVLLIDADMRLPSIGRKMELDNAPGLSNALATGDYEKMTVRESGVLENWHILTAGDIPPNPSELLASERLKEMLRYLAERYEYIVVDMPPVNIVSDALVAAPALDGVVVVARENYTERGELRECIRQMEIAGTKILGLVMTGVIKDGSGRYYKYKKQYGKYGDHYGYATSYEDAQSASPKED